MEYAIEAIKVRFLLQVLVFFGSNCDLGIGWFLLIGSIFVDSVGFHCNWVED